MRPLFWIFILILVSYPALYIFGNVSYTEKAVKMPDGSVRPVRIDNNTGKIISYFYNGWQPANPSLQRYFEFIMKNQETLKLPEDNKNNN